MVRLGWRRGWCWDAFDRGGWTTPADQGGWLTGYLRQVCSVYEFTKENKERPCTRTCEEVRSWLRAAKEERGREREKDERR